MSFPLRNIEMRKFTIPPKQDSENISLCVQDTMWNLICFEINREIAITIRFRVIPQVEELNLFHRRERYKLLKIGK